MSAMNIAFLALVVAAFVSFIVVVMSVHIGLVLSDAKAARGADGTAKGSARAGG